MSNRPIKPVEIAIAVSLSLLVAACAGKEPSPAPLRLGEDACNLCRMAVSQSEFAAQTVAGGQNPKFYDDVGCLILDMRSYPDGGKSAHFVADFQTGEWLNIAAASYVRSKNIHSPMGYGIGAFGSRETASAFANSIAGKLLTFGELASEVDLK